MIGATKSLKVRDVMTRNVYCASPEMPLTTFVAECVHRQITGAPVVNAEQELVGILSLSDVAAAAAFPKPEDDGSVGSLMTHPVHTVDASAPVKKAIEQFQHLRIHRLVVTYRKRVLGLVSLVDLLDLPAPTTQRTVNF